MALKGIYLFTNDVTGEKYVGQSINISNRYASHIADAENGSVKFHKALNQYGISAFSFRILEHSSAFTQADLDKLEAKYIKQFDSYNHGYNSTQGNVYTKRSTQTVSTDEITGEKVKLTNMLTVTNSNNKFIYQKFLRGVTGKNILLIGEFNFAPALVLEDNHVKVISDSREWDPNEEEAEVIYVYGENQFMQEINKIKPGEFDIIIANPPYNIGGRVVDAFVNKADKSIVLMPVNKYNTKSELYKHIVNVYPAKSSDFKDASAQLNLAICELSPQINNKNYIDAEAEIYGNELKKYYLETFSRFNSNSNFSLITIHTTDNYSNLSPNNSFIIGWRDLRNGHMPDTHDSISYKWNVEKSITVDELVQQTRRKVGTDTRIPYAVLIFKTTKEKDNFTNFIYSNTKFINLLFQEVKVESGGIHKVMPQVDWSHPWTPEEILVNYGYTQDEIDEVMKKANEVK